MKGKLIIISAPSGSGKTTIIKHLLKNLNLEFSVSATSREMRTGEKNGRDYYFLSKDEFHERIKNGDLLEYEEVYKNIYYGTLKSEVEKIRQKGTNVIFDVDIKGGLNIKNAYKEKALAIFIKPPNVEILRQRLEARRDRTLNIDERVEKAKEELKAQDKFDLIIKNDILKNALETTEKEVRKFLLK